MKLLEIKSKRKALTLFRARAFCGADEVYITSFGKNSLESVISKYERKGFESTYLKPLEYIAVKGEVYDLARVYITTFKNKKLLSHVEI